MSLILALDSATHACSVALQVGDAVFSRFEIAPRRHTDLLLSMIDAVLHESNIKLSVLNAIAVGAGPGSFMGVRLAVGLAQGLAFGANIPVIALSSLQILAQTAYEKTGEKRILIGWDARMEEVYWGMYALNQQNLMEPIISDQLSAPENIILPKKERYYAAGNAWEVYASRCPAELIQCLDINCPVIYPDAKSALSLAKIAYKEGKMIPAQQLEPMYLRNKVV